MKNFSLYRRSNCQIFKSMSCYYKIIAKISKQNTLKFSNHSNDYGIVDNNVPLDNLRRKGLDLPRHSYDPKSRRRGLELPRNYMNIYDTNLYKASTVVR